MKKIFLAILLMGAVLTSCDMNKLPYNTLDDETGIQTVTDVESFRNGMYRSFRGMTSGAWISYQDIQCDQFIGIIANGNRVGTFANALILSGDSDVESMWASCYGRIASANYIIKAIEHLEEMDAVFSDEDLAKLAVYKGEAKFFRAYAYFFLVDHFCQNYAEVGEKEACGLPIVLEYNPTGDTSKYPGRSTLGETYKVIETDLNDAYAALAQGETDGVVKAALPNAHYLNANVVAALQARVALVKGDYTTAFKKAEQVINTHVYALATEDDYIDMWETDLSSEVIYSSYADNTELAGSVGGSYLSSNLDMADYIPTETVLYSYADEDIRFAAFFDAWKLTVEGSQYGAFVFVKYPGNPDLKTGSTPNYQQMPKTFRLSETVLIAAEAAANGGSTADDANKYLKLLRAARYDGYDPEEAGNLSGNALINAIRDERTLELIGEGFRLSDLRRWKQGFTRDGSYANVNPPVESIMVAQGRGLTYQAGDHRFIWPIPSAEIESNPQMVGQQNPGY